MQIADLLTECVAGHVCDVIWDEMGDTLEYAACTRKVIDPFHKLPTAKLQAAIEIICRVLILLQALLYEQCRRTSYQGVLLCRNYDGRQFPCISSDGKYHRYMCVDSRHDYTGRSCDRSPPINLDQSLIEITPHTRSQRPAFKKITQSR